jgi:hypothetical protein
MKIHLIFELIFLVLVFNSDLFGQTYSLTVTNEPYDSLTNGTLLDTSAWSDPSFAVPVGFKFHYFDEYTDSLYSLDFFGGGYVGSNLNLESMNLIMPISSDLIDRGYESSTRLSPILSKTEGPEGHRIFTLEFRNAGFNSGELNNGIYTDYINVQLKIYEENDQIDVHIGPYFINNPYLDFDGLTGPTIGLIQGFDFINETILGEIFLLAEDPLSPTILTEISPLNLEWPIPENTKYTFSRLQSSIEINSQSPMIKYYSPNPTSGVVFAYPEDLAHIVSPVRIFNILGSLELTDNTPENIDLGNLPNGMYELSFQTAFGNCVQRISLLR